MFFLVPLESILITVVFSKIYFNLFRNLSDGIHTKRDSRVVHPNRSGEILSYTYTLH